MEQFSHDLTLALEETSRSGGVRAGRWGARRRTRSTGNLREYFNLSSDSIEVHCLFYLLTSIFHDIFSILQPVHRNRPKTVQVVPLMVVIITIMME